MALVEQAPTPLQTETERVNLETKLDHIVFELDYISDQSQFVDDQMTLIKKRMARFSSYRGRHTQKYYTLNHMLEHYKKEMDELTSRFVVLRLERMETEDELEVLDNYRL
jgi:DNA repair ATPase RecN